MWLVGELVSMLRPLQFRGKGRVLGWLVPKEGIRPARVFGARVELDLSDLIQRMVYLGAYERHETSVAWRYLKPGMTVVDVGANIGYYTLLAARRVGPQGRVFAFEPSNYAAERLEQTVERNCLAQVRVIRAGLASQARAGLLYTPGPGNHSPSMLGDAGAPATSVALTTLDECMTESQIERVDLLKIDVEGYEPEVLAGAAQALAERRIGAILCELNDPWLRQAGTNAQALYDSLLQAGFVDRGGPPPPLAGRVWTRLFVQGPSVRAAAAREHDRAPVQLQRTTRP